MDDLARHNQARWEALAEARVAYTCPWLDLNPELARSRVDPEGILGDVQGRNVLCLASGGGQQSAAFGLLGAHVTVLDLSPTQLQRDEEAARHYGLETRTVLGDMRDLSTFSDGYFDVVWQAHSFTFIPDPRPVFDEVARVLPRNGLYRLEFTNPFAPVALESSWNGVGYVQSTPYVDGAEVTMEDAGWDFRDDAGTLRKVEGPREFRHALETMINGLIRRGFTILGIWEYLNGDAQAEPGTWRHFKAFVPPWLTTWARLGKEVRNE